MRVVVDPSGVEKRASEETYRISNPHAILGSIIVEEVPEDFRINVLRYHTPAEKTLHSWIEKMDGRLPEEDVENIHSIYQSMAKIVTQL